MDRLRLGRSIRAIRVRHGWRQLDLAERAGCSSSYVSKVERGDVGHADVDGIERVCAALGADLDIRVRWRGEGLDRLLDEAHAALVDRLVALLRASGWEALLEATFSIYGERGSIDVLAWHEATATLLVVEVKSLVADAQGTLAPLDRKARLAAAIARERGWRPNVIARLLVLGERTVNRRRILKLRELFDAALPVRSSAVRRWLRRPEGALAGLLFLSDSRPGGLGRTLAWRQRVNPSRSSRKCVG
jgi:transcriptional regulator with XRE-family HTH domain